MPPKRCRIICIGGPIATPTQRDPGVAAEPTARHPARPRWNRCGSIGTDVTIATAGPTRWHQPAWNIWFEPHASPISIGSSDASGALAPADLLRQLVYLPQASIFVAEIRREVVGGAVLALRPSVRAGGFVGTVDFLVVDPDHDADRVTDALIEEVIRSARNKGCSVVEAALSKDPAERTRWARHGFVETGPRTERQVAAVGAAARRSR